MPKNNPLDNILNWKVLLVIIFLAAIENPSHQTLSQIERETVSYFDFKLSGTDSLTIKHKDITINGQITLSDKSSLIIKNSTLRINSNPITRREYESEITLLDEAELILESVKVNINVNFDPNYHTDGRIILRNSTKIRITDSQISCSSYLTIQLQHESSGNIQGSTITGKAPHSNLHHAVEDILPPDTLRHLHDDYFIHADDLSKLMIVESDIGNILTYGNASCTILDSFIAKLSSGSFMNTYVTGSNITLTLGKRGGELFFSGNHQGYHEEWDTEKLLGNNSYGVVKLVDSNIESIWLSLVNCDTKIVNATVDVLSLYSGRGDVTGSNIWVLSIRNETPTYIRDSEIDYLTVWSDSQQLDVIDSNVGWLGSGGCDRISINASKSWFGKCKLYNFQKPGQLSVYIHDSNIDSLEIRTGRETLLDFNNTRITGSLSLEKTDNFDVVFVDCSPIIREGVEITGDALKYFEYTNEDKKNDPGDVTTGNKGVLTFGFIAILLVIIVLILIINMHQKQ